MRNLLTLLLSLLRRHVGKVALALVLIAVAVAFATSAVIREKAHVAWHAAMSWAGLEHVSKDTDKVFWCPMHPQIKSKKENSVCPLRNMGLVELEGGEVEAPQQLTLTAQQIQQAAGMKKLRQRLEEHRAAATKRGDSVPSRFSEEQLEVQWAADLLLKKMELIRPQLPDRIVEQLPLNLVDIIESQGGIAVGRKEAVVSHLRQKWHGAIAADEVPLVRTTFTELTKDEMHKAITIPGMPNWWLMPIETRIGMLTTGMRGLLV